MTRGRLLPALVLVFATGVTAVWAAVAVRASWRGLDITDEGFYLLSYRWWNVDHRTFTGAQYVYGPVFALLGHDIPALRQFRLATILIGHGLFGLAFMRWLRPRRPSAPPTRLWEAAGTATVVAAGGAAYSWLPQSPGYNDIALLGALLGVAIGFALARQVDRGDRPSLWLPVAYGALAVPVLLTKWASAPVLAVTALVAGVALAPAGLREIVRTAGAAVAGAMAATAAVHLLIVPLTTAIPPMVAVNRLLARTSFAAPVLLHRYLETTGPTLTTVVWPYGLLVAAVALSVATRKPVLRIVAGVLGVAGLAVAAVFTLRQGGLGGGPANLHRFVVPLVATGVVAMAAAAAGRVTDRRGGLLLGGLAAVPLAYAVGSSNAPLTVSIGVFAMWVAVLVAVVTGLDRPESRGLTAAVVVGALLVVAGVATGGEWRHPYRSEPYARATATVPGVPALAGLRLPPAQARSYAQLHAALAAELTPPGRRVLGLDKMAGIVLLLDGRTVGEGWYAPGDPGRTRAGIRAACAGGPPWPADRPPILVLNRHLTATDATLLAPCGLDLRRDYRLKAPAAQTGGFTVLVPATAAPSTADSRGTR